MKRRIKITAGLLVIFLFLQLTVGISVGAVTIDSENEHYHIIVDQNGNGNYRTIQEAINNAEPGSVIFVKNGIYREIIDIQKQISLIGEEKSSTLINPISEKNKYAVRLGAPGVILKNFGIKNGAPGLYSNCVRITDSNIEVKECNIYETPIGIAIWTSDNIIDSCNFWGCTDEGIALLGTSYSDCNRNTISNCVFRENNDGIELQYSSKNTIENCDFFDNSHAGIDAIYSSNDENIISDCNIYNNDAQGIYLSSSSDNQIIDCSIYNNDDGNIIIRGESENNQVISDDNTDDEESNNESLRDTLNSFITDNLGSNIGRLVALISILISF